ncbi:hypothetical protein FACS1894205_5990 [Alphaproteobacteria bacterium]|nr:hypothetical protein FACS1894205_5990 [Alphaproteobacteria bacterium]
MPDILDRLTPASFRGVSFLAPSRSHESGRRGEVAEQPHSDIPFAQDTGRKARSWKVKGWVFTHDGDDEKNALILALDAFGPGRYVDPWGSQWTVKVMRWSVSESTDRGGLAEFEIEFAEDGEQQTSVPSSIDTGWHAIAAGKGLAKAAGEAFSLVYAWRGAPEFVRNDMLSALSDFAGSFLSDASLFGAANILELSDAMRLFKTGGDAISLTMGVISGISRASASIPDAASRSRFLLSAARYEIPFAPSPAHSLTATPDGRRQTKNRAASMANQRALGSLIRRASLAQLAIDAPNMEWESYDAAAAYADAASAAYRAEIRLATGRIPGLASDRAFKALSAANVAVGQDARSRGASLARLSTVRVTAPTPAAVLSYRLYDDARRGKNLARRNGVYDQNWLPPGRDLEALSR